MCVHSSQAHQTHHHHHLGRGQCAQQPLQGKKKKVYAHTHTHTHANAALIQIQVVYYSQHSTESTRKAAKPHSKQMHLSQVHCEFIRCWLVRVLIQTKSRSMGLEWRRPGSRLTSQPTSPWTAVKPVKVGLHAGGDGVHSPKRQNHSC